MGKGVGQVATQVAGAGAGKAAELVTEGIVDGVATGLGELGGAAVEQALRKQADATRGRPPKQPGHPPFPNLPFAP